MRDSRRLRSSRKLFLVVIELDKVYAWCEESYAFAKIGEIGHFINDVGCADGDDPRNTTGRNILRILATISGTSDDGDAILDGVGDLWNAS